MQDGIAVPVDSLFAGSAQFAGGSLQPGGYTLRYAFEGQVAGEYTFTVSPGGEVPEQTRGFANGVKAETDKGLVTLSWDGASIPDGAKVNAYYFYEGNSYYIYHEMEPGETSTELYTVPGRRMMAWVVWSTDGKNPELVPQRAQELTSIEAPESVLMTMNGFTNLRLSVVASRDADAVAKGQYLPESPITRVQLADEQMHFYFQTEDIYQIEENSTDHPLAVVLCTPDGQCFISASIYTFDRSLQNSDLWLMDITKLFRDHAAMTGSKAWPSGEYTVLYCIDGKLAGEYVFTLE